MNELSACYGFSSFLLMDDVTPMSFVGTLMALTHSILINLFIKLELNKFTPTSPAKYGFCHKYFLAYIWEVLWRYWKGLYFVQQHGVKRDGGRRGVFVRSANRNSFLGWKRDVTTLRNSSCYKLRQYLHRNLNCTMSIERGPSTNRPRR